MRDLFSKTSYGPPLSLDIPSHKTERAIKGLQEIEHLIQSTALQHDQSCPLVVGVDEAGRGPWAGPVVAAAVIFPFELSKDLAYGRVNAQTKRLEQLNDSKKLSEQRRLDLMEPISQLAIGIGVGIADPREIEELNIMQANYRAMRTAITEALEQVKRNNLSPNLSHLVLVDGSHKIPKLSLAQEAIIKGDQRSYHIAAASIIAKVTRDQIMQEADLEYPGYGFAQHKGYGTKAHQKALQEKGICLIHRRNYKPIKALIDD